ncbi:MAG: hypothetical protein DWI12_08595 [Planctomycetota bacterium]|nr:MAG: hypothetical protein DWI12_08595 [Planctomycetota bacterium]
MIDRYSARMTSADAAHSLYVFDDGLGAFGPLVDVRAAFSLRVGLGTMLERIEAKLNMTASALLVRDELSAITRESGARTDVAPARDAMVVNGRLLSLDILEGMNHGDIKRNAQGTLLAARCTIENVQTIDALRAAPSLSESSTRTAVVEAALANAPWDITARIGTTLQEDLALYASSARLSQAPARALSPHEGQSFGKHPIRIDRTATVGPLCVIDSSKGPVIIGANVVIRPLSVLVGPCAVLEGTVISERALIKANTVIGPHCRVGGEVGGTIFQSYSNKSHDGHLGDSFIGEWVNIGAGSDNSNLLNTYGDVIVRLEPEGGLLATGRQFWGSVIADHAKLAIGTRLMTGTTIGTGAMIALSRPPQTCVMRFAWQVDSNDAPRTFRFEKFTQTARAMMSRRGCALTPAVEARLRELHAVVSS